jgi:tRNA-2-methylthio-N6-dimethylallyladenosine synthase
VFGNKEKLFHQLGRWRKLKEKNPNLIIGVGGCVASQEGELILKRAPYVDMIFGPQTLHRLLVKQFFLCFFTNGASVDE